MAAFETPWLSYMATAKSSDDPASSLADDHATNIGSSSAPPTYASFSPVTLSSNTPSRASRSRPSTILVHQKSPLLLATPPQITRALAYSHPFLLPLNKAVGLLSWTTPDPWESFLVVCAFWAVVLYGDMVVRAAGPIVLVLTLILAMYGRRFSPLSSASRTGGTPSRDADASRSHAHPNPGHARAGSEATSTRHHKTLDEMVDTLNEFTGRCNVLLGPALELTDFLSTQRTPTSATTRPALTALFVRILFCTPFWYALTLPPLRIITTRRVLLLIGTLVLTWHARIMRVARAILWRSASVRRTVALVTGLRFESPVRSSSLSSTLPSSSSSATTAGRVPDDIVVTTSDGTVRRPARNSESELTRILQGRGHRPGGGSGGGRDAGVKFTFIIYENQRRWVGLGWTQSLFAYERAAWTDEHNNPVPSKDDFELPEVEEETRMQWRWVEGSTWRVDGVKDDGKAVDYDDEQGKNGWIYYDNKWQNGRRGQDGWGRWTRRRKWYRDAELVEADEPPPKSPETTAAQAMASASEPNLTTERYSTVSEKMVSPTQSTPNLTIPGAGPGSTDEGGSGTSAATARRKGPGAGYPTPSTSAPSTSSGAMSFFRMRRGTNQSVATTAASSIAAPAEAGDEKGAAKDKGKGKGKEKGKRKGRDRSASEAALSHVEGEEDEVDALELRVNLELQGQGDGGRWGIGDEARMSLE
ncbi:hypothetical protein ACRALDRAFT_1079136 [Sodiomyces alcalophilus JCM 7366]|uniref:uncharacterized protein n=1 Tax=Sodiomyces alcalophilus JCM 7366 TaxID=591952 RepID=UPI0039B438B2